VGKGTIISGGADGLYQVKLVLARDRITATIAKITASIAQLAILIAAADAELATMLAEINTLKAALTALLSASPRDNQAIESALKTLEEKSASYLSKQGQRAVLALHKTACEKRIDYLNAQMPTDPVVSAWCGDLTENLTGDVSTIEVPGERGDVYIYPGYDGKAVYVAAEDGQLQPSLASTPEAVFYNLALLPGWQKWKPIYRTGTIDAIAGDVCDVALDAAISTAQGLNVNQTSTISSVPIVYMDCNGAAFAAGDSVIIEFEDQDWTKPHVIGFTDNPKPCGEYALVTLTAAQVEYQTPGSPVPTTVTRIREILWDIQAGTMAVIPGVTFPADPTTDAAWQTWKLTMETVGVEMFNKTVRGTAYNGRSQYPMTDGVSPVATLPELDIPGERDYFSSSWAGDTFSYTKEIACAKPLWSWGSALYIAPMSSQLLESLIPSAPVRYSALRTKAVNTWLLQGDVTQAVGRGTFYVYSPYGLLTSYQEAYDYPGGTFTGVWHMSRNPQYVAPINHDALLERLYVDYALSAKMSSRSMVNIFFHQHRTVTFAAPTLNYSRAYYPMDILDVVGITPSVYGPRTISIHAQAVSGAVTGLDFVTAGRTTAFETALNNAMISIYDGLDPLDSQNIWQTSVEANIIKR
jgi:hypothetical protein